MNKTIESIPEKKRWEVATQSLTGAFTAISGALKRAAGKQGFDEFNGPLWYEAGKGAKEFAKSAGMPIETAEDMEQVTHLMAKVAMGPEFALEIMDATPDRCVGRATECPWHNRSKEQGIDFDSCGVGHQNWGDGAVASMNPEFGFKLIKNMNAGDPYCEWVVERKK